MFLPLYKKAENYTPFYTANKIARQRTRTHTQEAKSVPLKCTAHAYHSLVLLHVFRYSVVSRTPEAPARSCSNTRGQATCEGKRSAAHSANSRPWTGSRQTSAIRQALLTSSVTMYVTQLFFCFSSHYTISYSCTPALQTVSKSECSYSRNLQQFLRPLYNRKKSYFPSFQDLTCSLVKMRQILSQFVPPAEIFKALPTINVFR